MRLFCVSNTGLKYLMQDCLRVSFLRSCQISGVSNSCQEGEQINTDGADWVKRAGGKSASADVMSQ